MSEFTKTGEHVSAPGSHITSDMVSKGPVILKNDVPYTSPPPVRLKKERRAAGHAFLAGLLIVVGVIAIIGIPYNMALTNATLEQMNSSLDELNVSLDAFNEHLTNIDTKLSLIDETLMSIEDTLDSISANTAARASDTRSAAVLHRDTEGKGYLGITVTNGEAKGGKDVLKGVVVISVEEGSPADKAGIEVDDMILNANGEPVSDTEVFLDFMDTTKPGDEVAFDIIRNGWMNEEPIKAVLGEKEEEVADK